MKKIQLSPNVWIEKETNGAIWIKNNAGSIIYLGTLAVKELKENL